MAKHEITFTPDQLTAAFKAMRKECFVVRQNFLCCGGCAASAIATQIEKSPKRATIAGAVFFDRQDAAAWERSGKLCIRFSDVPTSATLTTVAVGELAVKHLRAQGVPVEWDGSPANCIIAG
jgi:hypothetical protein